MHPILRPLLILCALLCAILPGGCGGGSSGTGTGGSSIRVQGTVTDDGGAPIEGVTVTVEETSDFDVTDPQGAFDIETERVSDQVSISFEKDGKEATTTVTAPGENGTLTLTVKFNPLVGSINYEDLSVSSKIVGECDLYFENLSTIRQANEVPPGTVCTVKTSVNDGGLALAHVPIAIQFRACALSSPWTTAALGATDTGANLGIAQIRFPFLDDQTHCVYRIVTPFGQENSTPVITEILTFTAQAQ